MPELDVLPDAVLAALPAKTAPQQVSSVEGVSEQILAMAGLRAKPKAIHDKLRLDDPAFKGTLSAVKRL